MSDCSPSLKVSYLSGPADVPRFLSEMHEGRSDYFGTNYMKLFLRLMNAIDAQAQVVTWFGTENYEMTDGRFKLLNRPLPAGRGIRYHLAMLIWHFSVLVKVFAYRPDIFVLTGNQNYWWTMAPLRLIGVRFIASYHCVLWPKFRQPDMKIRAFSWLNGTLILRAMDAILSTSADIRHQATSLLGRGKTRPVFIDHLPSYDPAQFAGIPSPQGLSRKPFSTIFLGRLEANKGIYDIVDLADRLERERPGDFVFQICGAGSEDTALDARIKSLGLASAVICHGHCGPDKIRAIMSECHASIVPTRSDFEAGFEMTCSEAILSDRPLVASMVCPALDYLSPAAIAIEPDNLELYYEAIVRLADDREFYASKQSACEALKGQFFDTANGWYQAMQRALEIAAPGRVIRAV